MGRSLCFVTGYSQSPPEWVVPCVFVTGYNQVDQKAQGHLMAAVVPLVNTLLPSLVAD